MHQRQKLACQDRRATSLCATLVGWALAVGASASAAAGGQLPHLPRAVPPESLPVVAEHHYQVNGRVRLLLVLWTGRDDVGLGRIVWRGSDEARAFELLIGTDPDRAPRRLNRWGYLAEVLRGDETTVVGVMTESDERSIEEARARLATEATRATTLLKALRSVVTRDETLAAPAEVQVPGRLTYADARAALEAIDRAPASQGLKRRPLPPGTRPGFLTAAAELLHEAVARARTGRPLHRPTLSVPFVYNATLFDLALEEATLLDRFELKGEEYRRVARGRFVVRNRATGRRTSFTLAFGTDGPLAEVPIQVVYQPHWWLQIELVHTPDPTERPAARWRSMKRAPAVTRSSRQASARAPRRPSAPPAPAAARACP